jgi:membrane associated rhomboid family serine protease
MKTVVRSFKAALSFVGLMWAVHLFNFVLPIDLRVFGIHPREVFGLSGVLFCPFLHANLAHLVANSLALLPLLFIAFCYNRSRSAGAVFVIILLGGLGTWLFGSPGNHIGASGLVFGLIGFLLFVGVYFRDFKAIIVSVIVLLAYGASLLSLLIVIPGISWSGHFFGFLGGVFAAKLAKKNGH